ncbi:MFS transporter [Streptomyces sp. NPDC051940]|uniref:MFS transporter n=1 Tax=Streptomyces sp. NPDC051940 TaxID=3155675 RepID=UPI00342F63DC
MTTTTATTTHRGPALRGSGLAVLLAGQTMASMDGSIVTVALQTIRVGLGADDAALQLIVSGYILTMGVLIVTCARIGDLVGHRRAFLAGLAAFTAASLLCGAAPTPYALVGARIVQGAGAALMIPQVFSLIQLGYDGEARKRAIGAYSMVLALGVALGQVLGGLIVGADLFGLGWRPAFLVNVPVGIALLAAGPRLLPPVPRPEPARLDLPGVAVLTFAMTALIAPLILGREHGWQPWTWASLGAGAAGLVLFAAVERRVAAPVLDLGSLRAPGMKAGLLACFLVMGCYTAFLFALTLHLQDGLGYSPLRAGVFFLPYAVGFGVLGMTWTRLPARWQQTLPVLGPPVLAAAAAAVVWLPSDGRPGAAAVPLLMVAGAGHAAGYSPLIARLSALVGPSYASALSAFNSTGTMLASVLGVATLGGLFVEAPTTGDGLRLVVGLSAGLLAVTALCAQRVRWATGRGPR